MKRNSVSKRIEVRPTAALIEHDAWIDIQLDINPINPAKLNMKPPELIHATDNIALPGEETLEAV
jgi:hypothetical protein